MSESPQGAATGPSQRLVELGMAVFMAVFALVVIAGSIKAGNGWAFDGPQAGFFPFYIGLFVLGSSIVNGAQAWGERGSHMFAEWDQLRQVMSVVIPSVIYVSLVSWIGIYVSSALLIGFFMKRLGRYGWAMVLPIAVGVPLITFVVFERWFLVPLPKGPIEEFLGF